MNKYYFIFFIWLLPLYFVFQGCYQFMVYNGLQNTFDEGDSYIANVIDFDVKQIAAQTNGYVVLGFTTEDGAAIQKRLALPVQMAQVIMNSEVIPVRYLESSFNPIVIMPTYELQRNVVRVNLGVTSLGFIVTMLISLYASRFALKNIREGEEMLEIERLDPEEDHKIALST